LEGELRSVFLLTRVQLAIKGLPPQYPSKPLDFFPPLSHINVAQTLSASVLALIFLSSLILLSLFNIFSYVFPHLLLCYFSRSVILLTYCRPVEKFFPYFTILHTAHPIRLAESWSSWPSSHPPEGYQFLNSLLNGINFKHPIPKLCLIAVTSYTINN
jgi:hypothetical protein